MLKSQKSVVEKYNVKEGAHVDLVVVIVTFNSKSFVKNLLESITMQDYDMDRVLLLLIDNDSCVGTAGEIIDYVEKRKSEMPNIILVRQTQAHLNQKP